MDDDLDMNQSFDFSKAKKNPYISKLKKQITIRLDAETISYFKEMADETGIKYHITHIRPPVVKTRT
jgi:uncharacterized protein (DUF4415 family)